MIKATKERTVLVCMRRSELRVPHVKCRLDRCRLCLEAVWVSASSPKADEIFCSHCALDMARPGDSVRELTELQIADIRKALAL
jgi:hypothetical protein